MKASLLTMAQWALGLGLAAAVLTTAAYEDKVLVIVNEDVITQSEFDARKRAVLAELNQPQSALPEDFDENLLDGMISDRLQLQEADRRDLLALFDEYRAIQQQHADMPSIQMQLGLFNIARGDLPAAETAYREALRLNPQLIGAHLNLADLLRSQQRESEAKAQLQKALVVAPESGDAFHALGLLEARAGNSDAALAALGKAASLEQSDTRHRFVFAIAQHDFGDPAAAILSLRKLHSRFPADEQTLLALTNYSAEVGDRASAQRYAQKLSALDPQNRAYAQLLRELSR